MNKAEQFFTDGWCRFEFDPVLADWVAHALPAARAAVADPANAEWLRYGGTWFAGVNVLPNDATGALAGGPALSGKAVSFIHDALGLYGFQWDKAQVSVCYPGYPQPMAGENEALFNYRVKRDAAHVDGLMRDENRRRFVAEHHGFVLGIPLVEADEGASPVVVWRGSHEKVRAALRSALDGTAPAGWSGIDVTEAYHAVRREIFETCERVPVSARPGEAYLIHRLALHGVAPWGDDAQAGPDGRMIAYFRPLLSDPAEWLVAR
jgi:hypothetical protein